MSLVAALFLSAIIGESILAAPPTERPVIHVAPDHVRLEFERMAAQMPYLSFSAVVWDRDEDPFQLEDPELQKLHYRILEKISAPRFTTDALVGLLSHDDPKVRTLAIAALFDRADPRVLPQILRLGNDHAWTFQDFRDNAGALVIAPGPQTMVDQTVSKFAIRYVQCYVDPDEFAQYWQARKGRATCASWFKVELQRASQGTHPIHDDRLPKVEAVVQRVKQLPADEATWTLLYLYGEFGKAICSEEELLDRCRKLGREKILLALQRKLPSDDPDLQHGYGVYPLYFLLSRAKELLLPTDADLLLECERNDAKTPDFPFSGTAPFTNWFLAAVDLQPHRAGEILRAGLKRFDRDYHRHERCTLARRLWELEGEKEQAFIVEFFFQQKEDPSSFPDAREAFLQQIFDESPALRRLMTKLVSDPRLESLDPRPLCELATLVGKWTPEPVVSHANAEEFRSDARTIASRDAEQKYPKEFARYKATRKKLIADLQASLPKWKLEE